MNTVTLTLELPADRLAGLQAFLLGGESVAVATPQEPTPAKAEPVPAKAETAAPDPVKAEEPVKHRTKAELRALGVKLAHAGRDDELVAVFRQFGVESLKKLSEDDYDACYAALEALL